MHLDEYTPSAPKSKNITVTLHPDDARKVLDFAVFILEPIIDVGAEMGFMVPPPPGTVEFCRLMNLMKEQLSSLK